MAISCHVPNRILGQISTTRNRRKGPWNPNLAVENLSRVLASSLLPARTSCRIGADALSVARPRTAQYTCGDQTGPRPRLAASLALEIPAMSAAAKLDYTYHYLQPSQLTRQESGWGLRLATCGGASAE